jgi:hypothetical protein
MSGVLLAGCYTLQPARGVVPNPGTEVAFDVNDAGRVALGQLMGPEISQIEGRLISKENGEFIVAVRGVRLLRGGDQIWSGERVRLKSEHVGSVYERRFSPGRSAMLAAVGVGGFAAFMVTRSLILGSGSGSEPGPGPDPGTSLIRP